MDMKNSVQPGVEEPKAGLGTAEPPIVQTAASARNTPQKQTLDSDLNDAVNPPGRAQAPRADRATPEQQATLESNRAALKAIHEEKPFLGKAMDAFLKGDGPASDISAKQASTAIEKLGKQAPLATPAAPHAELASAPAPGMEDPVPDPESTYFKQPATEGQVREANRLLSNRLDQNNVPQVEMMTRTNEMLGQWVAQGGSTVPMSDETGAFNLEGLTKGQFNEVKAAAQSASIQIRAEGMDFEQMRPAYENTPAMTVGEAVKGHIEADIAKLTKLPEPLAEAARTPEIAKLLEAARGTNISLVKHQTEYNAANNKDLKVSIYDKAPELETAAKYAIAKHQVAGIEMTPESAAEAMKEAITAGTHAQLYKNADAAEVPNFIREIKLREDAPEAAKKDLGWMKEKINEVDVPAVREALAKPETLSAIKAATPESNKYLHAIAQKLDLSVPAEGLTKGDLATLRKEGLVAAYQKPAFDGKAPVSENTLAQIKDLATNRMQSALQAGLGVILLQKLKEFAEGRDVTFNKFDAGDLRKKDLLPKNEK